MQTSSRFLEASPSRTVTNFLGTNIPMMRIRRKSTRYLKCVVCFTLKQWLGGVNNKMVFAAQCVLVKLLLWTAWCVSPQHVFYYWVCFTADWVSLHSVFHCRGCLTLQSNCSLQRMCSSDNWVVAAWNYRQRPGCHIGTPPSNSLTFKIQILIQWL